MDPASEAHRGWWPGRCRPGEVLLSAAGKTLDCPHIYVYDIGMSKRKIHGKDVSDEQIQAWADEAEAGYDVESLRRRGRPTAGEGPGTVVPVRLDAPTLAALTKRAEEEGLANRSEAIRAAVRAWAHVA